MIMFSWRDGNGDVDVDVFQQLLKELEGERERRWKAEQAARKLADHVKDLQTKCESFLTGTAQHRYQ